MAIFVLGQFFYSLPTIFIFCTRSVLDNRLFIVSVQHIYLSRLKFRFSRSKRLLNSPTHVNLEINNEELNAGTFSFNEYLPGEHNTLQKIGFCSELI